MDVIFGACAGYPARMIRPFAVTLRQWHLGEVIFVTAHLPPDAKQLLADHHISEVEIEFELPCSNIQLQRYVAYREILEARPDISRAMLVDVRDVIFQGDPFPRLAEGALITFLEDETIGNCAVNTEWLETYYGADRAKELAPQTISCSGTTAGTRAGLLHYLDLMSREIAAAAPNQTIGGDQAMHNHLLYSELPEAVRVPNRTAAVQTLHYQRSFTFDASGRLLNLDRSICPLVHQVDRYPLLFRLWRELQGDG